MSRERLSIGEVCRRLQHAGEVTRTGETVWDRSAVWGMLKNPAYQGEAAFGKTRQGPRRPRLRPQRDKPLQPRRATANYDVPPEDWIRIAVPAIVQPDVFAAVQEQLEENVAMHVSRSAARSICFRDSCSANFVAIPSMANG